jgi:FtsP/CotA-like multicopper oxidase with cupredoxin domain
MLPRLDDIPSPLERQYRFGGRMRGAVILPSALVLLALEPAEPGAVRSVADACGGTAASPPRAIANDNRIPAGTRHGDTLELSLSIQTASWYPERDDGCAIPVLAFAEEGKAPSTPGPLIRVSAGDVLRVKVRNASEDQLWLHGLHARPSDVVEGEALAPGATRELTFRAGAPGTYAYGATLVPRRPGAPSGGPRAPAPRSPRRLWAVSQLVGAFVVDADGRFGQTNDRVMVLTRLGVPGDTLDFPQLFGLTAVNGKSWPHTERLEYAVGDSVEWHIINGSSAPHPMHLHGFYFQVLDKGTWVHDTALVRQRTVVTEAVLPGQTMRIRWVPQREGNWLFHCHLVPHMSAEQRLDRMPEAVRSRLGVSWAGAVTGQASQAAHGNHAMEGMAGLIVGIHVRDNGPSSAGEPPRRLLRLFADQRAGALEGGAPAMSFVLQQGDRAPAPDSVIVPSSTIVLRRGEPSQITVFNRLSVPLSVHWHGLEIESYFDGVGGWSGNPGSIAPPIAPGDSFVVRLTPPRAGTFMYHIHGEGGHELASGLYGALIVRDGSAALDTATDRILLIGDGGLGRTVGAYVNGSTRPHISLTAGRPHRLRLMGIRSELPVDIIVMSGAEMARWRPLAIDGAELTGPPGALVPAAYRIGPGMIADFELTPSRGDELTLKVVSGTLGLSPEVPGSFVRTWTVPIRVVSGGP